MVKIPTTAEYLDQILKKSLETHGKYRYDSDIATALEVTAPTMSGYRHNQNMSVIVAVKVAEMLGIHPMETIAATMEHKAKTDNEKVFWRHYYEKYSVKMELDPNAQQDDE